MTNNPNPLDQGRFVAVKASDSTIDGIVERVAQRERRRLRRWAIASTALWITTATYFVALLWVHLVFVHPALHEFLTNEDFRLRDLRQQGTLVIWELTALMFWPILLFLAAACTIAFTLVSRSATLRQIQTGLSEISEQVKNLSASS